jgi:glycosyltransferase involved in cell wall biosynthesis
MSGSLSIFVPHCSDLLTDHLPHGDGLIAHGFLSNLARRGHRLHVAVEHVDLREPLHPNITIHQVPPARLGRFFSRLEYMFRVRKLFNELRKRQHFDLIHQLNPVFTGLSLSLIGSRLPLVLGTYVARWPDDPDSVASQGNWVSRGLALVRGMISGLQQRHADAIVLTTPAARNRLPRLGVVRDRVYMLPHGVDVDLFSPETGSDSATRMLEDRRNPSILFFANVVPRKGIFTLLEAFALVAPQSPNAVLRIAGDGSALEEVKRRAAGLSCAGRIEFLGRQERAAAPSLYRNADLYCLPSHGEPYATTVLEAMSCGKAVVVTDAGGLPYMVHERGGKRVPVADPVLLAEALLELLRDPAQRLAMGRYNRKLVETTMTWENVAQQLEEIYRQTIQKVAFTRHGHQRRNVLALDTSSVSEARDRV